MIFHLSSEVVTPEIDYNLLINLLKGYRRPRDKISELLKKGEIIRVKKGLYVLGKTAQRPFHHGVLANLIYGPSYLSKEWALSYYGLIPEKVMQITSSTLKKAKRFASPVGVFTYDHVSLSLFPLNVRRESIDEQRSFLVASPEKALVELMMTTPIPSDQASVERFVFEGLRIDEDGFIRQMSVSRFDALAKVIKDDRIKILGEIKMDLKHESHR